MKSPILDIQNVTKVYHDHNTTVRALNGVSLTINQGEIFGLLGVNGAGKTTLSSILATLHPVTSGKVLFKSVSIYDDLLRYRKSLGFCPQKQNLDPDLTVYENLLFAGRYFLMPEAEIKERIEQLLEQLELQRYRDFDIEDLSGGNQQRVLIARALIHNPEIVLLDEPTVGLDPDIRRKLWQQISDLRALGVTVILTTHYLDEAEYLSDRVCILNKGNVVLIESVKDLREKYQMAHLEEIFLKITQEDRE
jgi:ABC-2 type transport system ATP-binding protein